MSGRAATALAVGWMSLCGALALAAMDGSIGGDRVSAWLSFDFSNRSSVHYKTSNAPFLMVRPKIAGKIEGEVAPPSRPRGYWI
jgi:hypothetical protein